MSILIMMKINFSLACGCRNEVAILDKFNPNGVSIFNFKKHVNKYEYLFT